MRTLSLTPHGMLRLKNQHAALNKRYQKIVHDLRENTDDDIEVRTLKRMEAILLEDHIRLLGKFLKRAKPLDLANLSDHATLGSHITYQDSGKNYKVTLVDPLETDPLAGSISIKSPIGEALLGKGPHESTTFVAPGGQRRVKVISVS